MIRQKVTQYCVPMPNDIASISRLAKVLSEEQIGVAGLMAERYSDISVVTFLTEEETKPVRSALESAGFKVFERPAFLLDIPNHPGEISGLAKCLADEDINIESIYGTTNAAGTAKLVLAVDQIDKAQTALGKYVEKARVAV